ncbi:hypothetical protein V8C40DRAFT_257222 [Trichoderma camerunense]
MDTTGSMHPYIEAAKGQVKSIINELNMTFFNEASIRIAIVGYKDHGDSCNIQFLDFTPETNHVLLFLNQLHAIASSIVRETNEPNRGRKRRMATRKSPTSSSQRN